MRKSQLAMDIGAITKLLIASESSTLRSECFPTLTTAGSARDGGVRADYHVPEFASSSGHTMIDLSIKNYSSAESLFDKYHDEIAHLADFRTTEPQLGERHCVRIIINPHGQSRTGPQFFRDGPVAPLETRDEKRDSRL